MTSQNLTALTGPAHPGPEWVLWAICGPLSPGEAVLRGRSAHAAAPGQVSFSNGTWSSKQGDGSPRAFHFVNFGCCQVALCSTRVPLFPKITRQCCLLGIFYPEKGVSHFLLTLFRGHACLLPFDLFPLLFVPTLLSAL